MFACALPAAVHQRRRLRALQTVPDEAVLAGLVSARRS
jgi:hypothetical protein